MPAIEQPYTQVDFSGGINLLDNDTQVKPNQYVLGFNIRTRFGEAQPVKETIEIVDGLSINPNRVIKGLYAFGEIMVCFVDSFAYYKTTANDTWVRLVGLTTSGFANVVYATAVPQATLLYKRKGGATPSDAVTLESATTDANEVALVVQDGYTQPWLIFSDGSFRHALQYDQWNKDTAREYVPIGRQMCFFNNILFIVSDDGKRVYRSVQGRPLDFVIAVNDLGNAVSNAYNLSFAADNNEIKLLSPLNAESLVIITAYNATAVLLNFDSLLYDEPTFNYISLFQAGVTNQFSWADILGDFAFIDKEGLKSFNAVTQLKFEGNNSVFSLNVAQLFKGIVQTQPCVGSFDNYTYFSVKTVYSPNSVLVYDNIKKVFSSIDILTTQPIIYFASTYSANEQRLFAATVNSIYELYSENAEGYKTATLFTRALTTSNSDIQPRPFKTMGNVKSELIRLQFDENTSDDAVVQVTELVNGNPQATKFSRDIPALAVGGILYPVTYPVMFSFSNFLNPINIKCNKGIEGQKISYSILWSGGAHMVYNEFDLKCVESSTTKQQQETVYNR